MIMEKSKLGLDFKKVAHAKDLAKTISDQVQSFVDCYSTVACERTLCRLVGIDGVDANGVPLPNVVVDFVKNKGMLSNGVLLLLGNAVLHTGCTPCQIAEQIADGRLDITALPQHGLDKAKEALTPFIPATNRMTDPPRPIHVVRIRTVIFCTVGLVPNQSKPSLPKI